MKHVPLISLFSKSSNSLFLAKRIWSCVGSMSPCCKLSYTTSLVEFLNDDCIPLQQVHFPLNYTSFFTPFGQASWYPMRTYHVSELPNEESMIFDQACFTHTPSKAMRHVFFPLHLSTLKWHNTHILHKSNATLHTKCFSTYFDQFALQRIGAQFALHIRIFNTHPTPFLLEEENQTSFALLLQLIWDQEAVDFL